MTLNNPYDTRFISFVIPTLNEEENVIRHESCLRNLLDQGHELIIVDGGSLDNTVALAKNIGCRCLQTKASRGAQLHLGARKSMHAILAFLHIDTVLPPHAAQSIQDELITKNNHWGRFDISFSRQSMVFGVIAWFMNKRSCLTSIVTGDHVLFIRRATYFQYGGYANIPLMEDVEFCKRLRKHSNPVCLKDRVITSSRKWEKQGVFKTILLMWRIRLYYFFGVPAAKLVRIYYRE